MPGPVPKRSDARLGHPNRAGQADEITAAPTSTGGELVEWPEPDESWHEIARGWFEALGLSGQRVFYQHSDVARARYVAHAMSHNLHQGKFSAVLFAAVNSAAGELLDTEGSRRRLRVEIERATAEDPEQIAAVTDINDRRARMSQPS